MSSDSARDYQIKAIDEIRSEFTKGHRKVLLWLATGGGKTFVFCRMAKQAVERGKRVIIVVRGRKLVDQASKRLFREGVPHGVLMAGHWNYRPQHPVQVCSIDTLIARKLKPEADLIVIDEAHLASSEGYVEFLAQYSSSYIVSVTATPWVPKGLRHIADTVVHPITMLDLVEQGFLAPARYFAPSDPNLSGVKVSSSTKDYVTEDLANVMMNADLTGDIIQHWKKHGENRPTICFAVNVTHSKMLVDRFNKAGIPAEHADADMPDAERDKVISRLESGETKIVCNVGIFCTGVDVPCLGVVVMARPTKSRNLFIQQAGRGSRPIYASGYDISTSAGRVAAIAAGTKPNFILLDHAGNIQRHGLPTDEPQVDLDGRPEREAAEKTAQICKNCFAVFAAGERICPECGYTPPPRPTFEIQESDKELKELRDIEVNPILRELKVFQKEADEKGWKKQSIYYRLINKFGLEACRPHLPEKFIQKYEREQSRSFTSSPFGRVR